MKDEGNTISSCLGCPFSYEGFHLECTLMCGDQHDENNLKGENTDE